MSIAERLIRARGGESRRSVCAAVGIGLSTLQMYENGRRIPRDAIKVRLAAHYRTSVEALFFVEDVTKSDRTAAE